MARNLSLKRYMMREGLLIDTLIRNDLLLRVFEVRKPEQQ